MPPNAHSHGGAAKAAHKGRRITRAELHKHNSAHDAWVAVEGEVYDISAFVNDHPGGRVLLTALGEPDSSDVFRAFHKKDTYERLKEFHVGTLAPASEEPPLPKGVTGPNAEFERDYRQLLRDLRAEGRMQASMPYYAWKFISTTGLVVLAAWLTLAFDAWVAKAAGALVLALFWQQCGWMAHDFAHHQVFENRKLNDIVTLIVGDLYQGFSLEWWKNKHNTHHAIPNLHESGEGKHDGDPDIDTLPFLAWSSKMMAKLAPSSAAPENTPLARLLTRHQALLYFPILFFARITWALQSLAFVFRWPAGSWVNSESAKVEETRGTKAFALRYDLPEKALLATHYAWVFALAYVGCGGSLLGMAAYIGAAETVCGLLLALAFGVGHNGMAVYDFGSKPGFGELQIRTTRNVHDSCWGLTGWFMGGLHYQVEHHLFPGVPRHNLRYAAERTRALCAKHGVPYHATRLWEGTLEVMTHLKDVASAVQDFPAM